MLYHGSTTVYRHVPWYYHGITMVDARSTIVKHSSTMVHHSILWYYYGIPHCTVVYHGSTMVFFEQGKDC